MKTQCPLNVARCGSPEKKKTLDVMVYSEAYLNSVTSPNRKVVLLNSSCEIDTGIGWVVDPLA